MIDIINTIDNNNNNKNNNSCKIDFNKTNVATLAAICGQYSNVQIIKQWILQY